MGLGFLRPIYILAFSFVAVATTQAEGLSVHFNRDSETEYHEPYRDIKRSGSDFEQILLDQVSKAEKRVWVAVQEIRLPRLAKLLAHKKAEGLDVRLVLENQYNFQINQIEEVVNDENKVEDNHTRGRMTDYLHFVDVNKDQILSTQELAERDAVFILRKAGVQIQDDTADGSAGSGLMHHKFVVIDSEKTIVSSANFTLSDTYGDYTRPHTRGNANSLLVFDHAKINKHFSTEFEILWGSDQNSPKFGVQKPYRPAKSFSFQDGTRVHVQFAGTSKRKSVAESTVGLILKHLANVRRQVNMAHFVYSEHTISDSLMPKVKNEKIDLNVLIEPRFAYRFYSKALDMWSLKLLPESCRASTGSNPWPFSMGRRVGAARLQEGDYLHHKFAVVDSEKVIVGSHNWSKAAAYLNDETLMVIESKDVAKAYDREFKKWNAGAFLGAPAWLLKKVNDSHKRCGI